MEHNFNTTVPPFEQHYKASVTPLQHHLNTTVVEAATL
jgi:hypothetical protein